MAVVAIATYQEALLFCAHETHRYLPKKVRQLLESVRHPKVIHALRQGRTKFCNSFRLENCQNFTDVETMAVERGIDKHGLNAIAEHIELPGVERRPGRLDWHHCHFGKNGTVSTSIITTTSAIECCWYQTASNTFARARTPRENRML